MVVVDEMMRDERTRRQQEQGQTDRGKKENALLPIRLSQETAGSVSRVVSSRQACPSRRLEKTFELLPLTLRQAYRNIRSPIRKEGK